MSPQQSEAIESYIRSMTGDFANKTLARKIVVENPGIFEPDDLERVRSAIRQRRGAQGDRRRHYPGVMKEFVREEMKPSDYMRDFISRAVEEPARDWRLPTKVRKPLILSDLHIPYHDEQAINASLDYGFKRGIDGIYINGDLIDFYQVSNFSRDPKRPSIQEELDAVLLFLEGLVSLGVPVFFKMGNHEERWNRYLLDRAPELHNLEKIQIKSILELDDFGVELIEARQTAQFGKLTVIHGHEFGQAFFNPVNPARGLFLRAKTSALAGHNHQTSSHSESNLNGKPMVCHSTGCLCSLSPDYRPFAYTKWNLGAAIVEIDSDGYFRVDNFEVIDGKVSR
jgi:UDP-2,3-diacylglucosamine pyrophosphatase LpxH